jgi:hypothetical protein
MRKKRGREHTPTKHRVDWNVIIRQLDSVSKTWHDTLVLLLGGYSAIIAGTWN